LAGLVETQSGNYKFKNNYFKFHITNFLSEASVSYVFVRIFFWEWKIQAFQSSVLPKPVDFIGHMKAYFSPVLQTRSFILIYNFIQQ
jgi:hypothetical protein